LQPGEAPPKIPDAAPVWSLVLDADAPEPLTTDAEFNSQRSAVIAGDRVVAVFASSEEVSRGGRPTLTYRLVSVELSTGKLLGKQEFLAQSVPALFATDDDHVVVAGSSLIRLNPDLTGTGEKFVGSGIARLVLISPDGGTLGRWTDSSNGSPGGTTELIHALSLASTGVAIKGPEPTAVSKAALLTNDKRWASQFPGDTSFVTWEDASHGVMLYRGSCSGRPSFLSEGRVVFVGCGKATILDGTGTVLKELRLRGLYGSFAGASRDGTRFAIRSSDYPVGDPATGATEEMTIYDSKSFEPVARVQPESGSWAAFATDGHLFLSGSARKINLLRVP
jgi:hypothetical protein